MRVVCTKTELDPGFLKLKDSSRWSGLGVTTLRQNIKDGRLKAYKVGGVFLISVDDLRKFVEQHEYVPSLDKLVDEVMEGV